MTQAHLAASERKRKPCFGQAADLSHKFARAVFGPVTFGSPHLDKAVTEDNFQPPRMGRALGPLKLQKDDLPDLLLRQAMEDNDLINPVEKHKPEKAAQHIHQTS